MGKNLTVTFLKGYIMRRHKTVLIMASALVVLIVSWSFKDLLLIEAGLDGWGATESPRSVTLKKVAEMDGGMEEFKRRHLNPFLRVRDIFSPGHAQVIQHIKDHFERLNWSIKEDSFTAQTPLGAANLTNIVTSTTHATSQYLVLACHFDSKFFRDEVFIGATDSAVPCALMLQLAEDLNPYLLRYPHSKYGLKLIFLDGEEALVHWSAQDSIYGANHLAQVMDNTMVKVSVDKSVSELQQISLFVLLDLIGTSTTTFKNLQSFTTNEFRKLESIEREMRASSLLSSQQTLFFDSGLYNYNIEDDHLPFLRRGVPVVHLISVPFPAEWHKMTDNEACLDYATISDVLKMMRMFVVDYMVLDVQ